MNPEEVETYTRFQSLSFFYYIFVGLIFGLIQLVDSKFRYKYSSKGYFVFLVRISKAIIPLSIITVMRGIYGDSFGEKLLLLFVVVPVVSIMLLILLSPIYLVYWIFKRIFRKGANKDQQEKLFNKETNGRDKPKRSHALVFIVAGAVSLLTLVVVGVIFSSSNEEVSFEKTDKSPEFSEQSGNLYRNTKYKFRIKFPEGWEITPGDGLNILQKAVKGNHTISIVIRELPVGFNDEKLSIKDVFTLKEFENELFNESYLQKYPEAKIIDSGETKIDNLPAFWYKMSFFSSALDITVDIVGLWYVLLYKNVFYFISAGTAAEEFVDIEPEFKKSIVTFVLEEY